MRREGLVVPVPRQAIGESAPESQEIAALSPGERRLYWLAEKLLKYFKTVFKFVVWTGKNSHCL